MLLVVVVGRPEVWVPLVVAVGRREVWVPLVPQAQEVPVVPREPVEL